MIAALLVIFIHAQIPGVVGDVILTVARLAVPFFFMVSGYYTFGKPANVLIKRAKKTFILCFCSFAIYFLWELFLAVTRGHVPETIFKWLSLETLIEAFVFNEGVIKHLWFLLALAYCYLLYIIFSKASAKVKLTVVIILLAASYAITLICLSNGLENPSYYSKNFLFDGLPHFLLGSIIKQRSEKLFDIKAYLLWIITAGGIIISLIESILIGEFDLYIGTTVACVALFVILAFEKIPVSDRLSLWGNKFSGDIYIIHMLVLAFINIATSIFFTLLSIPNILSNDIFLTIRPFLLFASCFIAALLKDKLLSLIKKQK